VLFASLLRLVVLRDLRDQIRPSGEMAEEEIFAAAREPALAADPVALTDRVAAILKRRAAWDEEGTKALCGPSGLALALPADFQDEVGLARLTRCQSWPAASMPCRARPARGRTRAQPRRFAVKSGRRFGRGTARKRGNRSRGGSGRHP